MLGRRSNQVPKSFLSNFLRTFDLDEGFDLELEEKNPKIHAKALGEKYLQKPKKGATVQAKPVKGDRNRSPGPGHYYDPNSDIWNKKTYNIMFADL